MTRARLSVALVIPPPLGSELDVLRRALGEERVDRVVPHLTLVPPVNVRQERVDAAAEVVRAAAAATTPLRLHLGPPATFLPDSPVLHLRVGGDLAALADLRDAVFVEPLARPLSWPFVPHVTLLGTGDPERLDAAARLLAAWTAEVTLSSVSLLVESRRDDGALRWTVLADHRLGGRGVVGRGPLEVELTEASVLEPAVAAWEEAAWAAHGSEQYGPGPGPDVALVVTARREGSVAGVAGGVVRGDEGHLRRLVVDGALRGQGVGGHLLAAFSSAAAERGAEVVRLRCPAGGPAERFYVERGFVVHAPLPAWRQGRDFVELRRPL